MPKRYYVVHRPSLKIIFVSTIKSYCEEEYKKFGCTEEYPIMDDDEFLRIVVLEHT